MDEEALETSLINYKEQLKQVKEIISNDSTDSQKSDLKDLVEELEEIIQISEEKLIHIKKEKLLLLLEDDTDEDIDVIADESKVEDDSESDVCEEMPCNGGHLEGARCLAPFSVSSISTAHYHQAIVINGQNDSNECRVLFSHPVVNSMRPCPYYLEGRCTYGEERCRYSHGHLIHVTLLKPPKEIEFSSLMIGSRCLAHHQADKLWYPATVAVLHYNTSSTSQPASTTSQLASSTSQLASSTSQPASTTSQPASTTSQLASSTSQPASSTSQLASSTSGHSSLHQSDIHRSVCDVVVRYEHLNKLATIPLHQVSSLAGDGISDGDSDDRDNSDGDIIDEVAQVPIQSVSLGDEMGCWEKHTKGIGSRLLHKMGFTPGQGLGREQQGIADPIPIIIYPQGKSLDACMKWKEGKDVGGSNRPTNKRGSHQGKPSRKPARRENSKGEDVFSYLNKQLNKKETASSCYGDGAAPSCSHRFSSRKDLGMKSFNLAERSNKLKVRLRKLEESKLRNKNRDKQMLERVAREIEAVRGEILAIKREEERISKEHHRRIDEKKISVF